MQATHRARHRCLWLIVTIVTAVALYLALTSDHRREVGQQQAEADRDAAAPESTP